MVHCDYSISLSVVDNRYYEKGCSKYWKIALPQKRIMKRLEGDDRIFTLFVGSFVRGTFIMHEDNNSIIFCSQVSFWGQDHGEDSWTGKSHRA